MDCSFDPSPPSTATAFDGSDAATAKVIHAMFFSEDGQRLLRVK